ncbi:hypothetical protein [Leptolyngbya sp. PCC 6406]|uniref:hypothetical protein n=1 Tax=Leptolyngbya sp. PCC 6406 TaxID=1173264 RepID=UPI0002ABF3A3|nr:hypothetical protein [Leptolyngbya sp. PCC 6406]
MDSAEVAAVDDLLYRFDDLAEADQGAFIEALIRKEKIQRIMDLVAKCAQARIEGIRDP